MKLPIGLAACFGEGYHEQFPISTGAKNALALVVTVEDACLPKFGPKADDRWHQGIRF